MTAGGPPLAANDAIMKSLTADCPTGETTFVRGLFVAIPIPITLLMARGGGLQTLRMTDLRGQWRAALLAGTMSLFITSLRTLHPPLRSAGTKSVKSSGRARYLGRRRYASVGPPAAFQAVYPPSM